MSKQEESTVNIFEEMDKCVSNFMDTLDDLVEQINKTKSNE